MVIKPMDLVQKSLNKKVRVGTRDGREFKGKLESYDDSLNIVLKDAEELITDGKKSRGTIVLKGGNTVYIDKI